MLLFGVVVHGNVFNIHVQAEEIQVAEKTIEKIERLAKAELENKFNHARVELVNLDALLDSPNFVHDQEIISTHLIEISANGLATFRIKGTRQALNQTREVTQVVQLPYEAWIKTWVAKKRILPHIKLNQDDFRVEEVNVAKGIPYEYRGVMVTADFPIQNVESRQTILEGTFLTTSAYQQEALVKRGDVVKLELQSGELSLTTQGVVQEPASVGGRVRVISIKSKKEFTGRLNADSIVEVKL